MVMCPCQPEGEEWNVLIGYLGSCSFFVVDSTIRRGRRASGKEKKQKQKFLQTVLGKELRMMATGLSSMNNREPAWIVEQRNALVRAGLLGY